MSNNISKIKNIQNEGLQLFIKKNIDYGDAFKKYGCIGLLMKIEDKISRCISITNNKINLINDESLRDTLIDLHNYAAMSIMLLDDKNN